MGQVFRKTVEILEKILKMFQFENSRSSRSPPGGDQFLRDLVLVDWPSLDGSESELQTAGTKMKIFF